HDLMARANSVSEILRNIPSVQVDINGRVSLRGSSDVMVLVNGRKSSLMGKRRALALQQLPASEIERIEVITNPSARFTPEGTSGIINIVMKQGAGPGTNGEAAAHLGADERHHESVALGGHPGRCDLYGSYSWRDDRRVRAITDDRTFTSGSIASYRQTSRLT